MLKTAINRGLILLSISTVLQAEDTIGYVKTLTPKAHLICADNTEELQVGSAVYVNCTLKTDAQGALGIALKDNTVLSFGPDTEFKINNFSYQPSKQQLGLDMQLLKGTLQYISGVIAKLKPNSVRLNIPTGIIAVRGTRFVIKVDD